MSNPVGAECMVEGLIPVPAADRVQMTGETETMGVQGRGAVIRTQPKEEGIVGFVRPVLPRSHPDGFRFLPTGITPRARFGESSGEAQ